MGQDLVARRVNGGARRAGIDFAGLGVLAEPPPNINVGATRIIGIGREGRLQLRLVQIARQVLGVEDAARADGMGPIGCLRLVRRKAPDRLRGDVVSFVGNVEACHE